MPRAVCAMLLLTTLGACTSYFFHPYRGYLQTPDKIGLPYQEIAFHAADGVALRGWLLSAAEPTCATVLFLHGNAENISTHIASVSWMPGRGFEVFLPDYRGYGLSEGAPSLPGLQADVEGAMRYLLGRPGVDQRPIVIFGQSLGGTTAIYYTAHSSHRDRIAALVVEGAFTGHRAIAREKLASVWLTWPLSWPLSFTVNDDYSALAVVAEIAPIPLLIVHGDHDIVVPVTHGQRLYSAARDPKEFWEVPNVGHIEAFRAAALQDRFARYLHDHVCSTVTLPIAPSPN